MREERRIYDASREREDRQEERERERQRERRKRGKAKNMTLALLLCSPWDWTDRRQQQQLYSLNASITRLSVSYYIFILFAWKHSFNDKELNHQGKMWPVSRSPLSTTSETSDENSRIDRWTVLKTMGFDAVFHAESEYVSISEFRCEINENKPKKRILPCRIPMHVGDWNLRTNFENRSLNRVEDNWIRCSFSRWFRICIILYISNDTRANWIHNKIDLTGVLQPSIDGHWHFRTDRWTMLKTIGFDAVFHADSEYVPHLYLNQDRAAWIGKKKSTS